MTKYEKRLLQMIRSSRDPAAALEVAISVILAYAATSQLQPISEPDPPPENSAGDEAALSPQE